MHACGIEEAVRWCNVHEMKEGVGLKDKWMPPSELTINTVIHRHGATHRYCKWSGMECVSCEMERSHYNE